MDMTTREERFTEPANGEQEQAAKPETPSHVIWLKTSLANLIAVRERQMQDLVAQANQWQREIAAAKAKMAEIEGLLGE